MSNEFHGLEKTLWAASKYICRQYTICCDSAFLEKLFKFLIVRQNLILISRSAITRDQQQKSDFYRGHLGHPVLLAHYSIHRQWQIRDMYKIITHKYPLLHCSF